MSKGKLHVYQVGSLCIAVNRFIYCHCNWWCLSLTLSLSLSLSSEGASDTTTLSSQCFSSCNCTSSVFDPVCGADGLVYFTPCHAGCPPSTNVRLSLSFSCSRNEMFCFISLACQTMGCYCRCILPIIIHFCWHNVSRPVSGRGK